MADRNILQIMPAAGWAAVFLEDGDEMMTPLAGWALVQNGDGKSTVVGMVAWDKVEFCDTQRNFQRYVYASDMLMDDDEMDEFDDDDDMDTELDDGPPYDPKTGLLN